VLSLLHTVLALQFYLSLFVLKNQDSLRNLKDMLLENTVATHLENFCTYDTYIFFISAFNIPHLDKKPLQEVVRPARGALARVIILNSITSSNKDGIRVVDD
jgi:hypothetical protein